MTHYLDTAVLIASTAAHSPVVWCLSVIAALFLGAERVQGRGRL